MHALARFHDALTEIGAAIAAIGVGATACIYTAEVVSRYLLDAPLNWSGVVSSYLLCACAFLALPKVTQTNGHVAIGYFLEQLSAGARLHYARMLRLVVGVVCLTAAVFAAIEGWDLFVNGVLTTQATQIPKWLIALVVCFGFASSALHLFFAEGGDVGEEAGI
jgi:TRAP-type C4-dicarboxylate transport system permease small subunit